MESFCEYTTHKGKKVIYRDLTKIESADDAYFVGHLAFDGSFESRNRVISIDTTSIFLLGFWKEHYCPTSEIYLRGPRSSEKVNAKLPCGRLSLPRPMSSDLGKFGLLEYKPGRTLVGIPREFMAPYTLGAVDAEGYFSIRHRKDCRTPRLAFGMSSSAVKLLISIQAELERINISSRLSGDDSFSSLRIETVTTCIKFVEWLYSRLPTVYNIKKKDIVDSYLYKYCRRSGELLETPAIREVISSQAESTLSEGSQTNGEMESLNNRDKRPTPFGEDIVEAA